MRYLLVYIFSFITIFGVYAQGLGVAVCIKETNSKPLQEISDELSSGLVNSIGKDILIYNWNDKGININDSFTKEERPAIFAFFINSEFTTSNIISKPQIYIGTDSTGIINNASITLEYAVGFDIRMIDVSTDEVIGLESINFDIYDNFDKENNPSEKLKISMNNGQKKSKIKIDVKKYFGRRSLIRLKSSSKEFNEIKSRIYKDYKSNIDDFNQKSKEKIINRIPFLVSIVSSFKDRFVSSLEQFDGESISDLNQIMLKDLSKFDLLKVYGKRTFANKIFIDFIGEFRLDPKGNKVYRNSNLNKGQELKNYNNFFVVKTESTLKSKKYESEQFLNLGLNIPNNKKAITFKTNIINSPGIKLIERLLKSELDHLRQLFIDSRFNNLDLSENINNRIGIDYFVSFSNGNVNFLSVETGEQLRINKKGIYCGTNVKNYWNIQSFNAGILKISGAKIEFVSTLIVKKDKVKKVEIFNPLGFNERERIYIFSLKKEVVNGIEYQRKEKIGHGLVDRKPDSIHNAILTVYKGKKKLFLALENKEKLAFTYDSTELF